MAHRIEHSKHWLIVTSILCVLYAVLAFPVFTESTGYINSIVHILLGCGVIWGTYWVRAWVFSLPEFQDGEDG